MKKEVVKKVESTVERLNGIEITIPENNSGASFNPHGRYHGDNYEDEQITENFKTITIKTLDKRRIEKRMFQNNIEETIDNDIKLVESGNIKDTTLRQEFTKIMLEKNKDYDLTVDGVKTKGKYLKPNTMKPTQLKFQISDKIINTDSNEIEVSIDGMEYKV